MVYETEPRSKDHQRLGKNIQLTGEKDLVQTALKVREHVIRMTRNGGCFIGASLSLVEIVVFLYKRYLRIENTKDPLRDYCFLSKGHDVPALYGLFVEMGWMESKRLTNHLSTTDDIYWHPNSKIDGVEFHSGSLGHLLSVGMGVALDIKLQKTNNRVVVILGDGELNEGSNWESLLVAHAKQLNNLIIVVDRNFFQANVRTEELIPLSPLPAKFEAFGCRTITVNGHDFNELEKGFQFAETAMEGPTVIVAETMRGKGLPSLQERADRWFCTFTDSEIENLIRELVTNERAELHSKGQMVR